MQKLIQAHGNWVEGPDRFYGREKEIALFIESLREGANILIVAQRRMGKTSLMREVERRLGEEFISLRIDLQNSSTLQDFVVELAAAAYEWKPLWEKVKGVFGNVVKAVSTRVESLQISEIKLSIRAGLVESNWQIKADEILEILAKGETPVILFMDEVPILVNRILKGPDNTMTAERIRLTDEYMSWIRSKSLQYQGNIRFVVTGSIGLEPILRQAKLSATINAFKPLTLPPWDNSTAVGCLRALANNYNVKISEEVCELMVSKLGCCIPHHVQMFFSHIYDEYRGSEDPVTPDMIAFVYTTRMLSSRGHAELSTFEERLEQMLGRELYPLAMDILTETAVVGKLTAEAIQVHCAYYGFERKESGTIARQILDIFEHDGYIMKERESYVFVSKLLKDWWKARHSFGFIIAEERGNA